MPTCDLAVTRITRWAAALLALAVAAAVSGPAQAQVNQGIQRAVGGVSINADGVLTNANVDAQGELQRARAEAFSKVPQGMKRSSGMRMVSLARLEAAFRKCADEGKDLPESIQVLAGLQQIRYVFVYPRKKDIVLAGPGEGWKVDPRGNIVGVTTGRPVMLLDDLRVALRTASAPVRTPISCSIDPTAEGMVRVGRLAKKLSVPGANPQAAAAAIEQALGPQQISFHGVPETSHFARVLVAADYRMKRVSMELEPAPIQGLPSFLQMMKGGGAGMRNMLPRWWLAPNYDPMLRDADGLAWELRGGVKAMAESDFFNSQGTREKTVQADPFAQRWADTMTRRYDDLALAEPVFGQLRNCMDLAIVGALVAKENLTGKAGCSLPLLTDQGALKTLEFPAPKQIDSKASLVKKGRAWSIAAGGVEINPWAVVEKTEQSDKLAAVRTKADTNDDAAWWWD